MKGLLDHLHLNVYTQEFYPKINSYDVFKKRKVNQIPS